MSTRIPSAALTVLTAQATYVGVWAALFPRSFYESFPGLNRSWVSPDGPYNEHLVRDVGGWYLALVVAGAFALAWRDRHSWTIVGSAWTVFNVLHLGYHLAHLDALAFTVDRAGEAAALGGSVALGLLVLAPGGAAASAAPIPATASRGSMGSTGSTGSTGVAR